MRGSKRWVPRKVPELRVRTPRRGVKAEEGGLDGPYPDGLFAPEAVAPHLAAEAAPADVEELGCLHHVSVRPGERPDDDGLLDGHERDPIGRDPEIQVGQAHVLPRAIPGLRDRELVGPDLVRA